MTDEPRNIEAADGELTAREKRASEAAERQGLQLCKVNLLRGGEATCRYDLVYLRYAQPVGTLMKLDSVEAWLGIREGSAT